MRPFQRALLFGAVLWLLATFAIRAAGQFVFRPDPLSLLGAFLIGGIALALLGPRLRLRISRDRRDADAVALGLILPGMFADAAAALGFRHVYPNLSPLGGNVFAALMLWYYAVTALAITLEARRGAAPEQTENAMLAVTMGDPAGIGGEITIKAWRALRETELSFVVLADAGWIGALTGRAGAPIEPVSGAAQGRDIFSRALPVIDAPLARAAVPGQPDRANAAAVIRSIANAVELAQTGEVAGIVTNPISKAVLREAGFPYPGHTEYLAVLLGVSGAEVMMLAGPSLRVVPVTVHVPLRDALASLTTDAIVRVARTTFHGLRRDFAVVEPRLAVAGLNPHAGESGHMGDEETSLIMPAIARLNAEGIRLIGPMPPDTMFTARARSRYDAAICMYHDQALIPLKTLDMEQGVNVTLGLPIVRTSPDHGTAFDISGTGAADPTSLIAAIRLADRIARNRSAA